MVFTLPLNSRPAAPWAPSPAESGGRPRNRAHGPTRSGNGDKTVDYPKKNNGRCAMGFSITRAIAGLAASVVMLPGLVAESAAQPLWKDFKAKGVVPAMTGWGGAAVYFDEEAFTVAEPITIKAEAGTSLHVEPPTIFCPAGTRRAHAVPKIVSGVLPPGIHMQTEAFDIEGVPTRRGKWAVRIQLYPLYCDDKKMPGFTQEMEFLIGVK